MIYFKKVLKLSTCSTEEFQASILTHSHRFKSFEEMVQVSGLGKMWEIQYALIVTRIDVLTFV